MRKTKKAALTCFCKLAKTITVALIHCRFEQATMEAIRKTNVTEGGTFSAVLSQLGSLHLFLKS